MAPKTTAAGATKRKRPSFNPPRPKPSKMTAGVSTSTANTKPNPKSKPRPKKPSRAKSPIAVDNSDSDTPLSASPSPSEEDIDRQDDEDDGNDAQQENRDTSPEPDFILAEISHPPSSSLSEARIPPDLLHRILHEHFARPEETKISKDAKELVGKYMDVFVREAIARCAFEVQGKRDSDDDEDGGGGGNESVGRKDDGWLEVADLEKVAVQLLLDF